VLTSAATNVAPDLSADFPGIAMATVYRGGALTAGAPLQLRRVPAAVLGLVGMALVTLSSALSVLGADRRGKRERRSAGS
jgi:hypothetical protein